MKENRDLIRLILIHGTSVLLLRQLTVEGLPKESFHLPGGKASSSSQKELLSSFLADYGSHIKLVATVPSLRLYEEKGGYSIKGYLVKEITPMKKKPSHAEVAFFPLKDLKKIDLEVADALLIEKSLLFRKALFKAKAIPNEEIASYYKALASFYKKDWGEEDYSLFLRLIDSGADSKNLKQASFFLCKIHQKSPLFFEERLKAIRKGRMQ